MENQPPARIMARDNTADRCMSKLASLTFAGIGSSPAGFSFDRNVATLPYRSRLLALENVLHGGARWSHLI
jgi:hypothetical protein